MTDNSMRRRKIWMNNGTDPVLELLALTHPVAMKTSQIHKNIDRLQENLSSRSTIYRAVEELEDHGYIEVTENGLYLITDKGLDYLDGEIENIDFGV